jgi:hypothetical protein
MLFSDIFDSVTRNLRIGIRCRHEMANFIFAGRRRPLEMRLTVCPTLNLCITILSILISGCYISLARAAEALSKSAYSVGFLLIILDVKKLRERGPPRPVASGPRLGATPAGSRRDAELRYSSTRERAQ